MRYLLDTNIVSEGLKTRPDQRVLDRMQANAGEMAIASLVWHELLYGAITSPSLRKRNLIERFVYEVLRPYLPILPYNETAAWWHAQERARLAEIGQTPPFVDGQIAAIAQTNGLVLVTKNVKDFSAFDGLMLEDWSG
jgi:tRNA(fMet)-specific endonuclease VapC